MSERKRKSLPICERLRGVRRGEREREREREKVIGYLDFFTQKNNEKNWVLKTI